VGWKRTERKAQRTENFALSENQCGMETYGGRADLLPEKLSENQCGMETLF